MPRPLRLDEPGAHFHISSRGVERRAIFLDSSDRLCFLQVLSTACERYGGDCHAYCLMGNHYHLFLESVEGRVASLMQHLNGTYGRWFNRRRGRVGHLFQGRYGANLIDRDEGFLEVVRYIELNPCRAGLVEDPADWEWSSFRARMFPEVAPPFLRVGSVLERFGSPERYRRFVLEGLSDLSTRRRLREETIIGSEAFVSRHADRARRLQAERRVPLHQRTADRPALAELLRGPDQADRRRRAVRAFTEHGYSMTEIARELEVHYTTIGRWVRGHEM